MIGSGRVARAGCLAVLCAGLFQSVPELPFALLAGGICNATEAVNLHLTGGPSSSAFLFPYYLVFFGVATLYPARLWAVVTTAAMLPLGYLALGLLSGIDMGEQRYVSNLILLVDYAGITCIANRVVTAIFLREVQLRTNLENANSRLRELDRLKSELFANVSHELRSPLTLILAPATSLLRGEAGPIEAQQRTLVDAIHRNASRLLALINDLLLLSRLDAGRLPRTRRLVDLDKVVQQIVESTRAYAQSLQLTLRSTIDPGPALWVGDARHAERILTNLLSNACKFSRPGGDIHVELRRAAPGYELSVSDQGIGIPREHLPRVFERFVQVESAASRRFEGTGIGLAIVKELAEVHGGSVSVESEPGRGSRFSVLLPACSRADMTAESIDWLPPHTDREPLEEHGTVLTAPAPAPPSPALHPHAAGHDDAGPRARVMIVEDSADLLRYLAVELGRSYRVEPFQESTRALEHALHDPPDLIISDVMMPLLDGIELARRLRAQAATRSVPIVLLSARDDIEAKVAGFDAGVDDYLQKPFQALELHARIAAHIRLRSQSRQLEQTASDLRDALDQLKQTEATLVQNEKLAMLGRVVAGVAHEVNNPLHFLHGNIELLRDKLSAAAPDRAAGFAPLFRDIQESYERIAAVTRELLLFGRRNSGSDAEVALEEVAGLVMKILVPQLPPGVHLRSTIARDQRVRANPQDVFQILMNLVSNAVQAVEPGVGEVRIDCGRRADGLVELRVADNGCGIAEEDLARVCEPFFTTKPPGEGTGLGLAITERLVAAQQGELHLDSTPGHGTVARVALRGAA